MVVVITGASMGIGYELLKLFEAQNHKVYCLSRSNPNNHPFFIKCDVSNETEVINASNIIKNNNETVDILINNSGVGLSGATELLDSNDVKKVIDVNFYGVFYMCKHFIPLLSKKGKIVNMASVIALFPRPFHTIYSAVKASVLSFSYGLRMELSSTDIQVCAICPTGIESNFSKNRLYEYQTNERYLKRIENSNSKVNKRKRMDVSVCSQRIYKKIKKAKLKPNYIIGNSFKILLFFQKIFPMNTILKVTDKKFGGHK